MTEEMLNVCFQRAETEEATKRRVAVTEEITKKKERAVHV